MSHFVSICITQNGATQNEKAYGLQHDCLRVEMINHHADQQILYFCMIESSLQFSIDTNNSFQKFTCADLSRENITQGDFSLYRVSFIDVALCLFIDHLVAFQKLYRVYYYRCAS